MRQTGVLAAAGLVALDEVLPSLAEDHTRAVCHAPTPQQPIRIPATEPIDERLRRPRLPRA